MRLHEIGPKIKILRKEKNLTQEKLSKLAGISRVTLGKIEKGTMGNVSLKSVDIILNALSYEFDIIYRNDFGLDSL